MSIFYHAGDSTMTYEKRKDSHRGHFMLNCSAFAMGDTGDFATAQEVMNSVGNQTSTFMGPTLWSSDTSIFARMNQNDWVNGEPLGSHLDMLHQSPYAMGVAFEKDNVYWVFDGQNKNLCRYDFEMPHPIGGDDHSDGRIRRYTEVSLVRKDNLPAHMVIDPKSGWLYIVDNSKKRIIRVDINSGEESTTLTATNETLAEYRRMKNVKWEVYIDTGLVSPCGIDLLDNRLVVSDNSNGDIVMYTTDGPKGIELGRIKTGYAGIMGVKIGPDSNIWYVNFTRNEAIRLTPDNKPGVPQLFYPALNATRISSGDTLKWLPAFGAISYKVQLSNISDFSSLILDSTISTDLYLPFANLEAGTAYFWRVQSSNAEGPSSWSTVWKFTTLNPAPVSVTLVSPPHMSENIGDTVTLMWLASQYADRYRLQASHDASFATLQLDTFVTTASFLAKNLDLGSTYYWHVLASGEGGDAQWSDVWQFKRNTLGVSNRYDENEIVTLSPSYPNPTSEVSTISFSVTAPMPVTLIIYNSVGIKVKALFDGLAQSGVNSVTTSTNELSAGVYYYVLRTPKAVLRTQFIVVHH